MKLMMVVVVTVRAKKKPGRGMDPLPSLCPTNERSWVFLFLFPSRFAWVPEKLEAQFHSLSFHVEEKLAMAQSTITPQRREEDSSRGKVIALKFRGDSNFHRWR